MTKIGKNYLFAFLLLLSTVFSVQADVVVNSLVDRNQLRVGDTFKLTVEVSSGKSVSIDSEPRLPSLQGVDLLNAWSEQESRQTFVNGDFRFQISTKYNYMLAATKEGSINIGGVEVVVAGKVYRTKPISVKVFKASSQAPALKRQRRQRQAQDPFEEMEDAFAQLLRRRPRAGITTQPTNSSEAFFIQVEVDKTDVYVGEQVTASWYLYTRGHIRDIDTLKYPTLKGFWKEDIEIATRLVFENEIINGIQYRKALLAKYALFPIKKGKSLIDAYKAKCTVLTSTAFGFGQPRAYTKASKPVKINVLPTPLKEQPKDFAGVVGRFNVSSKLESNTVPANQPITMKIRFEGRGNAKLIDLPEFELPASVELYDTKKESKFYKNGTSYKEFEVLLIPREEGEIKIPAMSVSFFDPENKIYYTKKTPEATIKVTAGKDTQSMASSPAVSGDLDQMDSELSKKIFKPGLLLAWDSEKNDLAKVKGISWFIVYLLAFAFLIWRMFKEFGWGKRKQSIEQTLQERIKAMRHEVTKGEWRQVGIQGTNAIYYILGEISGVRGGNAKLDDLLKSTPPSVRNKYGEEIKKVLSQFELLGFAPEEVVGKYKEKAELKKCVATVEKLLQRLVKVGVEDDNVTVEVTTS